jgi:hypothetical protein
MFGYIFLILGLASSFLIVSSLGRKIFTSDTAIFAASIPLFFTFHSLLASLFTLAMPTGSAAIIALGIFVPCGFFSWKKIHSQNEPLWISPANDSVHISIKILLAVVFFLVSFLIIQGFTVDDNGTWSIGGTKAVDTPYHIGQAIRIATTEQWDFQEPNFSGEFIRYSYYINFVSGILMKFGIPVAQAMHIPSVLLTFSWAVLIIYFLKSFQVKSSFIFLICLITLFGTGLGYIGALASDGQYGPLLRGDAVWPMQNIAYPGMIPGFLIWQRSFILGFPVFLIAALLFIQGLKERKAQYLFFAGIVTGSLPFVHMHSFIALMTLGMIAFAVLIFQKDSLSLVMLRSFLYPAFLVGIPQVAMLILLPRFPLPEITTLRFGWMSNPIETGGVVVKEGANVFLSWLRYMWTNFGALLFAPLLGIFYGKNKKLDQISIIGFLSAMGLWALPNLVKFQIWDFDNNKLFPYAILMSLIFLALCVQNKKYGLYLFIAIALLSTPSSFMEIKNIINRYQGERIVILDAVQKEAAQWVKSNTPVSAVFLPSMTLLDRAPIVQDPIIIASGRRATSAYKVLIFTHGIDSFERREAIAAFYEDPNNKDLLNSFPADYLIADDVMRINYPDLELKLARAGHTVVFDKAPIRIFHLKK